MSFLDIYMPEEIPGYPCVSAPRTRTTIQVNASGKERRNQEWVHPLHQFILPEAIARDSSVINDLKKHWLIMAGPFHSFPWRDPLDKATVDHVPNQLDSVVTAALSETDQHLGFGDGFADSFQLVKTYSRSAETYDRTIHLPVLSTVIVAVDGVLVDDSEYTVSRPGGIITFNVPPPNGDAVTAGFMFDNEVRFESDDALEGIVRSWQVGGFADITLIEVRPC